FSLCARALICGYSFFSHCWTRASSRSKARCRGFWQVIPSWARSRPTETRLKAILNLSLINLATISRVHSAKANFICSGFFCVTVSKIQLSDRPSSFGGRPNKGFAFKAPSRRADTAPTIHIPSTGSAKERGRQLPGFRLPGPYALRVRATLPAYDDPIGAHHFLASTK